LEVDLMDLFSPFHASVVIGYIAVILGFGGYISKTRVKNDSDFVVAGHTLPFVVMMGTLLATWCGSGNVIGQANFVYQHGPWAGILYGIGEPIGMFAVFFLAAKIRSVSSYTIPQVMELRYGTAARLLTGVCIILAYVGIVSYQFKGGGYILHLVLGISPEVGTILTAVFVVALTILGGMFSVAYTDALSAGLITFALVIAVPFVTGAAGGLDFFSKIEATKMTIGGGLNTVQLLGFVFPVLFLLLGEQNLYQRFASAKDEATAKKSVLGFLAGNVVFFGTIVFLVCGAIVLYPDINPDTALLMVFRHAMPAWIGSLGLAAATAFIVTTADSYLLSCSTNVTYDFIVPHLMPNATSKQKVLITRLAVVVLGLVAYSLITFFPSVLAMQMYSYTMYGASITPALLAAYLWKKATPIGGIVSILAGAGGTLFWEMVLQKPAGLNSILFSAPLSILCLVVVSLATWKGEDGLARMKAKAEQETMAEA
jgi:SSS family solute:Na+ symporter